MIAEQPRILQFQIIKLLILIFRIGLEKLIQVVHFIFNFFVQLAEICTRLLFQFA